MVYGCGTGHLLHRVWMGAPIEWYMDNFYYLFKEKKIGNFCEKSIFVLFRFWLKISFFQWIILLLSLNLTRIWVFYSQVHKDQRNEAKTMMTVLSIAILLELCESSWCHFEVTALMSFISCQSGCTGTDDMEDMSSCLEAITRTTSQQHRTLFV